MVDPINLFVLAKRVGILRCVFVLGAESHLRNPFWSCPA